MKIIDKKKRIESVLLICALVTMSIVIVLPFEAPEAEAVVHLASTTLEDNDPTYDVNPTPGVVEWTELDDHIIDPMYIVDAGHTLVIRALNWQTGGLGEYSIQFAPGGMMIVSPDATLITNDDSNPATKTCFRPLGASWGGIVFEANSNSVITDCLFLQADMGVQYNPGSILMSDITETRFENYGSYGLKMDGAQGATNIGNNVYFTSDTGIGCEVANGHLNITPAFGSLVDFKGHGTGQSCLHIVNSVVDIGTYVYFYSRNTMAQPGYGIQIEDSPAPNSTTITSARFYDGYIGDYYIRCDGASPFFESVEFEMGADATGAFTLLANDNATGVPSNPILRNPLNYSGPDPFENASCNATGSSSITIQWYLDVYVIDDNSHPIGNSRVEVIDVLDNPADPFFQYTDAGGDIGWARDFICTELIIYDNSVDNFNPFNISAENNTKKGYVPLPYNITNISKAVTVVVPFSITPNTPPIISYIETPGGVQGGDISIDFIIYDPNEGQNGTFSIFVEFSPDGGLSWFMATAATGSCSETGLSNATIYTYIWESNNVKDMQNQQSDIVIIRITPSDGYGPGTPGETFQFSVDNKAPTLTLPPSVSAIDNTSATITWGVDEPCYPTVWYGYWVDGSSSDLTDFVSVGVLDFPTQEVTLTGLDDGRNYTFAVYSEDEQGFIGDSESELPDDGNYTFETDVYIQLYEGWNMFSVPMWLESNAILDVLASIIGDFDTVWCYFAGDEDDPWKLYDVNKPFGNDLVSIGPGAGVWIHMLNDAVLVLDHDVPTEGLWATAGLYRGWNFIGYPCGQTRSLADALDSEGVNWDVIRTYNAASGKWKVNDKTGPAPDDLTDMEICKGYWIYVLNDFIIWSLPYADYA